MRSARGASHWLRLDVKRDDPEGREALGVVLFEPTVALLSHRVSSAVPSPKRGLTSEFGMGSGVAPALWTAGKLIPLGTSSRRSPGDLNVLMFRA